MVRRSILLVGPDSLNQFTGSDRHGTQWEMQVASRLHTPCGAEVVTEYRSSARREICARVNALMYSQLGRTTVGLYARFRRQTHGPVQ